MKIYEATEQAYKNGYEQGKKDAEYEIQISKQKRANIFEILDAYERGRANALKWIPVSERLPESGVHVLVACEMYGQYLHGQYVCDGFYVERYTQKVENTDYDIACEYCEEDDEYYLWQGWYEVIKNWDDYNSIVIGDTVTHWMPLPEPPTEVE